LVAPEDCQASLILKLVAHAKYRYYACWLLVGRFDTEAMSVRYKFTGENTVRCDLPTGAVLSAAALQPHLVKFLKSEGTEPPDTPVIIGKNKDSSP
jgi:hypothetical protein